MGWLEAVEITGVSGAFTSYETVGTYDTVTKVRLKMKNGNTDTLLVYQAWLRRGSTSNWEDVAHFGEEFGQGTCLTQECWFDPSRLFGMDKVEFGRCYQTADFDVGTGVHYYGGFADGEQCWGRNYWCNSGSCANASDNIFRCESTYNRFFYIDASIDKADTTEGTHGATTALFYNGDQFLEAVELTHISGDSKDLKHTVYGTTGTYHEVTKVKLLMNNSNTDFLLIDQAWLRRGSFPDLEEVTHFGEEGGQGMCLSGDFGSDPESLFAYTDKVAYGRCYATIEYWTEGGYRGGYGVGEQCSGCDYYLCNSGTCTQNPLDGKIRCE